LAAVELFARRN